MDKKFCNQKRRPAPRSAPNVMNTWIYRIGCQHGTSWRVIRTGQVRTGNTLPSQRLMVDFMGVHTNAVNRAMRDPDPADRRFEPHQSGDPEYPVRLRPDGIGELPIQHELQSRRESGRRQQWRQGRHVTGAFTGLRAAKRAASR
jgi:GntR family transcriptional regulator